MGKARAFATEGEDANYLRESEDETYKVTQQNSYNLGSTTFSDQSGIGNFAQSGTDQRKANLTGALFRGNIGFLLQSAVLDETSKTINLLEDQSSVPVSDVSSDRIVIISGIATTADLEIILGAQRPGQRLVLYNTDGNTITIKDASTAVSSTDPNLIRTPGALDYIITGFDSVQLVFDSIEEQWRIVGAVGTGGGTGYNLIKDPAGVSLTQRTTMKFLGNIVSIVDNVGTMETEITISSPSGTIPDGTAENQHLEWDNTGLVWLAVDFLTMGATGPFASVGLIRTANDQFVFASRNVGDSGDIAVKVNSSDKFIFQFPGAVVPLEISFNEIDVKTVDIVNIDRLKFVQNSGSMIPSDTTGILKNSNAQFQFNSENSNAFLFTFNTDTALTLTPASLTLQNTSSTPFFTFFRDEPGADDQIISNIIFRGRTASGGLFIYSSLTSVIDDSTLGQESSTITLNTTSRGTFGFNNLIINADSDEILRYTSVSNTSSYLRPVFELVAQRAAVLAAQPDIGQINFNADTDDGGGIGAIESFAQIISRQEDPDINNESGSLRFRLRDQTGVAGSLKTYLQFNDSSNAIIEARKDITLENFTLNPVLTLFRNQTGVTDNPLGNIVFRGRQSNDNPFTYSTISSVISDATLGQEDSIITLSTTNDGILANVQLIVNADSSQILRFASASPTNSFNSPIFEFLTTASSAPPTGAVQRIAEINFEATTNDAGGVGAVETFAQIIVDQEESDITNEAAGMRFRLRDQSGTAGALKTYLQFNDGNNGIIQALKDFDFRTNFIQFEERATPSNPVANNGLIYVKDDGGITTPFFLDSAGTETSLLTGTGGEFFGPWTGNHNAGDFSLVNLKALGFNDAGGQISVDPNVFQFVTTSPSAPFRFTPQGTNILDIDDLGLEMQSGDIRMGNGNISGLNELQFNIAGQVIRDGTAALTIEVGANDTIDFIVNSIPGFQVNQTFCDFFDSFWDMTQRLGPIFNPPVNQRRIFVNPATEELSVIRPDSVIVSLETGGGGGDVTNAANVGIGTGLIFRDKIGSILNFKTLLGGLNISITNLADTIRIDATGVAAGFYNTIQDEGSSETQQPTFNFIGSGVSVANDGANNRTNITIPGGGGGTSTDVILGSPPAFIGADYVDTTEAVFGVFAFDDLALSLPTSKPALPNISHTLTSADFPIGALGYDYLNFGFSLSLIVSLVPLSANKQFKVNVTLNEVEIGPDSVFVGSDIGTFFGGQFGIGEGRRFTQDTTVVIGDRIGAKVWISSGGTGLLLQDFVQWIFPTKMEVSAQSIMIDYFTKTQPFGDSITMIGTIPAGQSFTVSGAGTFVQYQVGGDNLAGSVTNDYGNDQTITNFANLLGIRPVTGVNNSRGKTTRSTDAPQTQYWHKYRAVT